MDPLEDADDSFFKEKYEVVAKFDVNIRNLLHKGSLFQEIYFLY